MSDQQIDARLIDHAKRILAEADIPQESRARLWDEYYDAATARELANRVANFGAPDEVKRALVAAKRISDPGNAPLPEPVARVVNTFTRMSQIDPAILAESEKHPALAKALIDAALKGK